MSNGRSTLQWPCNGEFDDNIDCEDEDGDDDNNNMNKNTQHSSIPMNNNKTIRKTDQR